MELNIEKNEINKEWETQKKRRDPEAILLREFLNNRSPYKPGTEEDLNFDKNLQKKYCEKLGGIALHEFYHKLNTLICMVDSNKYKYTLRMISDLNNIGFDSFDLSIAHNNETGNQEYTYLTYPSDREFNNLQEVLDFMDAEVYETSYNNNKIQHKLIIKDPEKEKKLYEDELKYKD